MKYNVLGHLIGEGFRNVFKNKKSTGASLMIMCATMIIFGVFFIIGENINHMMVELESQQGMKVFIEREATDSQISKVEDEIRSIQGVNKVTYESKEEALNIVKDRLKDRRELLNGWEEDNPFSDSYYVTLTDLNLSKQVETQINEIDNVKSVQTRDDTINTLINVANGIRIVSFAILILLVVISIFIIANTIKLTVHARRREISIMKYVGATNGFIRWPFIVEGIIIGIIAALVSVLLVGFIYNGIADNILKTNLSKLIELNLLTFADMFDLIMIVYLGLGIGIGTLGSIISMRKYLEV